MPFPTRKVSVTNALALGIFAMLLSLAGLCAAVMPSPAGAQNTLADLGVCMAESDCFQGKETLPDASNCTEKYCFSRSAKSCPGNTGVCYVHDTKLTLSVPIGNVPITDLGGYIQAVYDFAIGAAAVFAAVMMMIGGLQYLTAGGDSGKVTAAKDRVTGALIGLVLVSAAYLILNTINPNLTNLQLPLIPVMKRQVFVGCENVAKCKPCGEEFGIKVKDGKAPTDCSGVVAKGQGDVDCVGKGCDLTATHGKCDDSAHICVNSDKGKTDQCGLVAPGATAAWVCAGCTADGGDCSTSGPSEECCRGFCMDTGIVGKNKCGGGHVGDDCGDDDQCRSGICQTNWGNTCSSGGIGMPCAEARDCVTGVCNTFGTHSCSYGKLYNYCGNDKECPGLDCADSLTDLLRASVCIFPGDPLKTGCTSKSECGSGMYCNSAWGNFCTDGSPGVPCSENDECAPPSWKSAGICVNTIKTCTDGSTGSACRLNEECQTGVCFLPEGKETGACVTGEIGTSCRGKCKEPLRCTAGICTK
jgi:hypothetical protein